MAQKCLILTPQPRAWSEAPLSRKRHFYLMFIATIIPHIREFVRRHAPAGPPSANLMSKFDKVRRTFQEQQDGIYQKLVEIMESRALILSKKPRAWLTGPRTRTRCPMLSASTCPSEG